MKIIGKKLYGCEKIASGYLAKFAKTHKLPNPILVPIRTKGLTGSGDAQQCHTNALVLAYRYGGTVLNGYYTDSLIGQNDSNYSLLWGHSVWVTPEGNAVCPTAHNTRFNEKYIRFIPCFEHDENAIRDFFQKGAAPIICRSIMFSLTDASYVLAIDGEEDSQVDGFTRMTKIKRKQIIKNLAKKGLAGTKNNPLRSALLTEPSFATDVTLEWFMNEHKKDFLHKVFPNGFGGDLNAA